MILRPGWDEYYLAIAKEVSKRASCSRKSHGCVIVNENNRIVSTGYNGSPSGHESCIDYNVGCYIIDNHCRRAEHAERNAIYAAAADGIALRNSSIYITGQPCIDCLRAIISCGIIKIVYDKDGHYSYPKEEQDLINLMLLGYDKLFEPFNRFITYVKK